MGAGRKKGEIYKDWSALSRRGKVNRLKHSPSSSILTRITDRVRASWERGTAPSTGSFASITDGFRLPFGISLRRWGGFGLEVCLPNVTFLVYPTSPVVFYQSVPNFFLSSCF